MTKVTKLLPFFTTSGILFFALGNNAQKTYKLFGGINYEKASLKDLARFCGGMYVRIPCRLLIQNARGEH